jgi:hypothetical protein
MTVHRRNILAALAVAVTIAGATTLMGTGALCASAIDAELLKLKELKQVDAAWRRELRRLPDRETGDENDDDDDDDDDDDSA